MTLLYVYKYGELKRLPVTFNVWKNEDNNGLYLIEITKLIQIEYFEKHMEVLTKY